MEATVSWDGDVRFVAESGSGHAVTIDGPESEGGANAGPRPMEMMLMGLGGCTAFDVMMILKKSRQAVESCVARIDATRADTIPSAFTDIHIRFEIKGTDIKESHVKRAVELSAEKYCSASIMLEKGGVNITHGYEIIPA